MSTITIGPAVIKTESIDCDIQGMTLEVISVLGRTIIMRGNGGTGWWVNSDGVTVEVDEVNDMEAVISLPEAPEHVWTLIHDQLLAWAEQSTPLRFIGASVNLLWDGTMLIPLPRSNFPNEVDQT